MARQAAEPGKCTICKEKITKRTAARHFIKEHAEEGGDTRFLILVDTPYSSPYWMVLLADPSAELSDLDKALRSIWVECCSHMSSFTIMGEEYLGTAFGKADDYLDGAESMEIMIQEVLAPGMTFKYEYDFGTTTQLRLKVVDLIPWTAHREKVLMVVMNDKPVFPCSECGRPAEYHYTEWDDGKVLCIECSSEEDVDDCYLLPICNSPRTGQCAYEGGRYDQ